MELSTTRAIHSRRRITIGKRSRGAFEKGVAGMKGPWCQYRFSVEHAAREWEKERGHRNLAYGLALFTETQGYGANVPLKLVKVSRFEGPINSFITPLMVLPAVVTVILMAPTYEPLTAFTLAGM